MLNNSTIFTVGHSTHSSGGFLALLRQHGISAVLDVRSTPYSRAQPQFNRETLTQDLRENGIRYVFLGEQLGARSKDANCYVDGQVQYRLLAKTDAFRAGLERVRVEGE